MRRILLAVLMVLVFAGYAFAAGTVTQKIGRFFDPSGPEREFLTLTFTFTGDSSDGSLPSTATTDTITDQIKGYWITEVRTNPGATAPTDNYDIVINDTDGIDLLGGSLANRDTSTSEVAFPLIATGIYSERPVDGALTMVITNNSVNSATGTVKVFLTR